MLRHRRGDDASPAPRPASRTHGNLYELDAIAAVVIGGTLLTGGRGTIVGTVLGVLIFTTLTNVFTLNNLSTSAQTIAKGVIIVVAVLLQQRVARRRRPSDHRTTARAQPPASGQIAAAHHPISRSHGPVRHA